jgi:hypothetical protein
MMSSTVDVAERDLPVVIMDGTRRPKPGITITFSIKGVITLLIGIVTTLVIVGTIADIIKFQVAPSPAHRLARLMNRFVLSFEPSIPNWYASAALLCSGALLGIIATVKWQARDRFSKYWAAMAAMFIVFSIDEGVRLHEMIHTVMIKIVDTEGMSYSPSVFVTGVFVAAFAIIYIPFLKHIDRRTAALFVIAGGVYVFGTVVMDMCGSMVIDFYGEASIQHTFSQLVEESCEMFGIVVFLYALGDYIRRCVGPVQLCLV